MFTPDVIEVFKNQKNDLLSKIDRLELELEECKTSVSVLEALLRNEGHSILEDHFDADEKYPFDGNLSQNLLCVLKELGETTAEEIAEKILDWEDMIGYVQYNTDDSKERLFRIITLYASRLCNESPINARKVGNTNL